MSNGGKGRYIRPLGYTCVGLGLLTLILAVVLSLRSADVSYGLLTSGFGTLGMGVLLLAVVDRRERQ